MRTSEKIIMVTRWWVTSAKDGADPVFDATQVNPGITIAAHVPFRIPAGDRR